MNNNFFGKLISFKGFIVFLILYLLMFFFVLPAMTYPQIIPDKIFHYSAQQLYSIISNYSAIERQNYIKASLLFDIIYPIIYTMLLFIALFLLIRKIKIKSPLKLISFSPFIAFVADISENILIMYNIKHFDNFNFTIAKITSYLTTIKWSFIFLSFFMIIIFFIYINIKKYTQKK